jgi:hypothetical protein
MGVIGYLRSIPLRAASEYFLIKLLLIAALLHYIPLGSASRCNLCFWSHFMYASGCSGSLNDLIPRHRVFLPVTT